MPPPPTIQPGNPILVGFLREWYETAKAQNAKGTATYKRAYDSMKACPIAFSHPSEAISLAGLGPKLCERLTTSYEDHCRENGLPLPQKPRGARRRTTANAVRDYNSELTAIESAVQRSRKKNSRSYVPQFRSGPYALLIALWGTDPSGQGNGEGTKQELIDAAREHCDASFDVPADTTKYYTAWNSMKTLTEKNLVYCRGHPKRYCLTEGGQEVARGIVEAQGAESGVPERQVQVQGNVGRPAASGRWGNMRGLGTEVIGPDAEGLGEPVVGSSAAGTGRRRRREEMDELDEDEMRSARPIQRPRNGAAIQFRGDSADEDDIPRTVEERRVEREAQRRRILQRYSNRDDEEHGQGLHDFSTLPRAPNMREVESSRPRPEPVRARAAGSVFGGTGGAPKPPPARRNRNPSLTLIAPSSSALPGRTALSSDSLPRNHTSTAGSTVPSRTISTATTTSNLRNREPSPALNFAHFSPTLLMAKSFTVELIVDNREVRSKSDRDYLQTNLANAGVNPTTRPLAVGDALWVAREIHPPNREIVLDYIVERKRMDDLLGSIKDGRFHEQKFRLAKSGVKNVIYIIEDFSLRDVDVQMRDSIDTAISSTQVVNRFFVKRTSKLDDTIRYLVRMTKLLQETYRDKDLYVLPENMVESRTYGKLREHVAEEYPGRSFYLPYQTFSELVNKSASITLRDLFLKMLMCTRGVSAEKALEVQSRFATPREFVEALERCGEEQERSKLVAKACRDAVGRRKIGAALSKKIAEVWWGEPVDSHW
jgi:crossover junction endonuclease MUS81